MKGQMSLGNYVVLFFVLVIAIAMMPALTSLINDSSTTMTASPNGGTSLTITVMELMPFLLIICIVLTAVWYSIPHQPNM